MAAFVTMQASAPSAPASTEVGRPFGTLHIRPWTARRSIPSPPPDLRRDRAGRHACGQRQRHGASAVRLGAPALVVALVAHRSGRRSRIAGSRRRLVRRLASRLGYSQRVEDDTDDEGPTTTVLDFTNTQERLDQIGDYTRTPITLLSGFLGAGKTSLLKHILENQEGVRLGVVVNDVAAVNIDAQLVQKYERGGAIEIAELSNGCICCTASDDLVASVQELVNRAGSRPFHHVVIELSGVGEPEAIRHHWDIGVEVGMPATMMTEIKRTIAVVDASLFGNDWIDSRNAAARNEEGAMHEGGFETVGQLLAEQVEKADVVLVNKTDLASAEELRTTEQVVRGLNPKGEVIRSVLGKVSPIEILPEIPHALKYPEFGKGKNYRWAQNEHMVQLRVKVPAETKSKDIQFKIGRTWVEAWIREEAVPRLQGKMFGRLKCLDEWLWELEGAGDDRHVAVWLEKTQPGMWEDLWEKPSAGEAAAVHEPQAAEAEARARAEAEAHGHDNGHGHGHAHAEDEESGHGHAHGHDDEHGHDGTTAQRRFGIHTFTYEQRRPFSSKRLDALFEAWPLPKENKQTFTLQDLDLAEKAAAPAEGSTAALKPVLRSKGFCWVDSDPLKMQEWAHAGRTLTVQPKDWWWSVLREDQLQFQVSYPGAKQVYERTRREKWDDEWGDRRQELVFIGGPEMSEENITPLLHDCLLDDEELAAYRERTASLVPPETYFGIEGLLRQMGEDPANFGRGPEAEAEDTEVLHQEADGRTEVLGKKSEENAATPDARGTTEAAGADDNDDGPADGPAPGRRVALPAEAEAGGGDAAPEERRRVAMPAESGGASRRQDGDAAPEERRRVAMPAESGGASGRQVAMPPQDDAEDV